MLLATTVILICFPLLMFILANKNYLQLIIIMYTLYSGLTGFFGGALCSYLVEKFSINTRYTGSTIAYNAAVCFIGPITPLILTALWGNQLIINFVFVIISIVVWIFLLKDLVISKKIVKTNGHGSLL